MSVGQTVPDALASGPQRRHKVSAATVGTMTRVRVSVPLWLRPLRETCPIATSSPTRNPCRAEVRCQHYLWAISGKCCNTLRSNLSRFSNMSQHNKELAFKCGALPRTPPPPQQDSGRSTSCGCPVTTARVDSASSHSWISPAILPQTAVTSQ